jgi:hypothetical protein
MKINNLTRKDLYKLVWSKPISALSKEHDLSDAELRKICHDYQIPLPKNGHWSKLKFSKPVKIIPFIEDFEGSNIIQYVPKVKSTKALVKKFKPIRTEVPLKLTNPLPEILEAEAELKKYKFTDWWPMTRSSEVLSIKVSNFKLLNRALRIMDVFLKTITKRAFTYEIVRGSLKVRKYDIVITINCRELNNRKFFKDKHGWNSSSLTPNGILSINIEGIHPKQWKDGKLKLEERIDIIVLQLDNFFMGEKLREIEISRYWREVERLEKERLARQKVIQNDIDEFKKLKLNARRYHECQMMRDYINAASKYRDEDWIQWANDAVDWYDPIILKPHEKLDYADRSSLELMRRVL